MDRKSWIVICLLTALAVACAAPLRPVEDQAKPPQTVTPPAIMPTEEVKSPPLESIFSNEVKKDEELFSQAMHQLAGPFNQDASSSARQTLESLLNGYAESKWTEAAQATLRLIAELDTHRQRLPVEQNMVQKLATDRNRALQESEQLKKDLRLLNEKCQADMAGLQQENEQLKKDLQLLKNLEIQLDRREKMLR